jgi:IclR family transcriptional regulator, acetate operon repressor
MQNKPAYFITSVDNALQLALLLGERNCLRLREAAEELGVAQSTAHRLLTMLCYRGFAAQLPDKSYVAGPLRSAGPLQPTSRQLTETIQPHLEALLNTVNETAQFAVLTGGEITFLAAAEGLAHTLSVQAQTGRRMPAHLTAGGRAILAALREEELARIYGKQSRATEVGTFEPDFPDLLRRLTVVRQRGYATNSGEMDRGINAIGVCVRDIAGRPVGAITVSAPSHRLPNSKNQFVSEAIKAEVDQVADLHWGRRRRDN